MLVAEVANVSFLRSMVDAIVEITDSKQSPGQMRISMMKLDRVQMEKHFQISLLLMSNSRIVS